MVLPPQPPSPQMLLEPLILEVLGLLHALISDESGTYREPGMESVDARDLLRADAADQLLLKVLGRGALNFEVQVLGSCQVGAHWG